MYGINISFYIQNSQVFIYNLYSVKLYLGIYYTFTYYTIALNILDLRRLFDIKEK